MATYTINVTQEDISHGESGNCALCPIARAMTRTLGRQVYVDPFEWDFAGKLERYPTPEPASNFIVRFDNDQRVSPFTFTVEVPN